MQSGFECLTFLTIFISDVNVSEMSPTSFSPANGGPLRLLRIRTTTEHDNKNQQLHVNG